MSIGHRPRSSAKSRRSGAASFRYGYREVKKKLPNGKVDCERVPLTLEDVPLEAELRRLRGRNAH
jgi:hypothetical protein